MKRSLNLELLRRRYKRLDRKGKSALLDELVDLHDYNRKYLIQYFNFLERKKYLRRGRKRDYVPERLIEPLKRIWLASDQMCSKKLEAALKLWLPFYEKQYGVLEDSMRVQLLKVSASTIDRLLKPYRARYKRRGLTGTKPGYLLKNQIPIKTDHWDVTRPGFLEADSVAHCGNTTAGDFAWSITLTDIATGWTEIRAVWNKGAEGVVAAIKVIENALHFPILGFDCDNGSEFLNWHLIRYFGEGREEPVQFTRSRPYRKNDNAHVEQKNWTHVRQLFGYDRFDKCSLVPLMNAVYENDWSLYQNHFVPTMKLITKEKINSKYRKVYSKPQTPYERLITSDVINEEQKTRLEAVHRQLDPFQLKINIEKKLKKIFAFVTVNKKPKTCI